MSRFCTNCGATLADDAAFCTECGASVSAGTPLTPADPTEQSPAPEVSPVIFPESVPASAAPELPPLSASAPAAGKKTEAASPETRSKEISVAGYFWLMLLFYIPAVGLLAALVFAFLVKNKNLRNFARANLIWVLIGLIVLLILAISAKILLSRGGVSTELEGLLQELSPLLPQGFSGSVPTP